MKRAAGFTLLELLLATVLCAMVMIAVLGMITRIVAQTQVVTADDPDSPVDATGPADFAADAWTGLLAEDLFHAVKVTSDQPGRLVIVGYHALQGRSRQSVHMPVRVHYETQRIGGVDWLVRRQVALNAATNEHVQRDLVCAGVTRWTLTQQQGPNVDGRLKAAVADPVGGPDSEAAASALPIDDPNENIVINGNNYFRRNVPAWYFKQGQAGQPDAMTQSQQPSAEKETAQPLQPQPAIVNKGTLWRLRAWRDDAGEPDVDRLVTIR